MSIGYTSLLALVQPVDGTEVGTWGDDVNNGVSSILDVAVAGTQNITTDANVTLTITQATSSGTNLSSTSAQYAILLLSGSRTATRTITLPASSKTYTVMNSTTGGYAQTVGGLTIAVGEYCQIAYNTSSSSWVKTSTFSGAGTFSSITNTSLTSGRVVYSTTGGLETDSSSFTFDGTTLTAPSHTFNTATTGSTNKGPLNYGTLNFSDTGIVQSAQTSVNSYFQNVIQNTSNGTQASAEFIAYNDQGTATTNYATVGINSSGYSGTGSINAPGYGYFLTASTDLVLGTIGANGIHFTTNSSATDALAISSAGAVSFPGGTANGVAYLNGSKVLTTGSALTFDGTNLGLGTASPGVKFDIVSGNNTSLASVLRVNSNNVAVNTSLAYDGLIGSGQLTVQAGAASALIFGASGSEQMRLTSTGLGIKTSSPSYPLDVNGYGRLQGGLIGSGGLTVYGDTSSSSGMFLSTAGNLGLGVTPSAWASFYKGFDISTYSAVYGATTNNAGLINNGYFNGSNWIYKNTAASSNYSQSGGSHAWYIAPSGTAGNAISFSQAATLTANGNYLVGTTTENSGSGGIKVAGQFALTTSQSFTTSGTVNSTTYYVVCYSLSGTCTLTLPAPSTNTGRILNIVVQSAQQVVSASSNVTKITDGTLTTAILPATAGKWAQLWCDGTYWNIIATNV